MLSSTRLTLLHHSIDFFFKKGKRLTPTSGFSRHIHTFPVSPAFLHSANATFGIIKQTTAKIMTCNTIYYSSIYISLFFYPSLAQNDRDFSFPQKLGCFIRCWCFISCANLERNFPLLIQRFLIFRNLSSFTTVWILSRFPPFRFETLNFSTSSISFR